ncbi:DUF262 domain-containing protein [Mesomycoplasma neurolyticum]|uniref:Uncharacterized conserved protein n=1 Tax=Mesomycoplasma neurolyticum TaxID=2120 RepID=A0A449A6B0_9BACT|nr:DUF262 domain-containing protein [Mesomycoplasma neurolyticum]VEU59693.1 Uncharacterized conserved protein [Mesomycoplasma neurolyticum]
MKVKKNNIYNFLILNQIQYHIPVYQRNYDWNEKECQDLFDDILEINTYKKNHFLGTLILIEENTDSYFKHFSIVDGQQRITTIYLLLKVILDLLEKNSENTNNQQNLQDKIKDLLFNNQYKNENKLKLKPILLDNEHLLKLMQSNEPAINLNSNIFRNYNFFKNWFLKKEKNISRIEIAKKILQNLKNLDVVVIELDKKEDDQNEIFERINSTGKELSLSDLVRNFLLTGINTDNQIEYENYWTPMENSLKKDNLLDEYIWSFLYFDETLVANEARVGKEDKKFWYKIFKRYAKNKSKFGILRNLHKFSEYFLAIKKGSNIFPTIVNTLLNKFTFIAPIESFPLIYFILKDYEEEKINLTTLTNALKYFINYFVRRFIVKTGKPTYNELFRNFYSSAFQDTIINDDNYLPCLVKEMEKQEKLSTYKMPSFAEVENALLNHQKINDKNKTTWGLSLLLIAEKGFSEWAESNINLYFQEKDISFFVEPIFFFDKKKNHNYYEQIINNNNYGLLGNWMILEIIASLKIKNNIKKMTFDEKQEFISESTFFETNKYILEQKTFSENEIQERNKYLAKKVSENLKNNLNYITGKEEKILLYPEKQNLIIEKQNSFLLYELGDVTFSKPYKISLLNNEMQINSWANLFLCIVNKIYSFMKENILNLELSFISDRPIFEEYQAIDNKIFINTRKKSAQNIISLIKQINSKLPMPILNELRIWITKTSK